MRIESGGLCIDVLGYQFPKADDCFWDGNWLKIEFRCRQPGREVTFKDHCLRTDELKHFSGGLADLSEMRTNETALETMEPFLKWRITRGARLLSTIREARSAPEPREFTFELKDDDIAFLKEQIDAVLDVFPVRGDASR